MFSDALPASLPTMRMKMRFLRRITWRRNNKKIEDKDSSSTCLNSYEEPPPVQSTGESTLDATHEKNEEPPPVVYYSPCSIAQVPALVTELSELMQRQPPSTTGEKQARILRQLFAISEDEETRGEMIADGRLVPVVVQFLERCRKEQEQQRLVVNDHQAQKQQPQLYLALLLINNLSIPAANKRAIALEGAPVLSRLIMDDPSCHLTVILVVNWIVQDVALRRELVTLFPKLISSLAVAFCAASLPPENYRWTNASTAERVAILSKTTKVDCQNAVFPDTMRWVLIALQHLIQPAKEISPAAQQLMATGIVPSVLQCIKTDLNAHDSDPSQWEGQTTQDAALFVILNLATDPVARKSVASSTDILEILAGVAAACTDAGLAKSEVVKLQFAKARIALTYIISSSGSSRTADHSILRMRQSETDVWVELLANLVHCRHKEGPGGYSTTTFSLKQVLFALRRLLRGAMENQTQLDDVRLNALLIKVIGLVAVQRVTFIDMQAAEHACFSLYLLSHHGFQVSTKQEMVLQHQLCSDSCSISCLSGLLSPGVAGKRLQCKKSCRQSALSFQRFEGCVSFRTPCCKPTAPSPQVPCFRRRPFHQESSRTRNRH